MSRVMAQAAMELRLLLRNGENVLVTLGIPVGLLVFFSTVRVLPVDGPPVDFLLPGMLTVGVMGSAMVSLAISTGFERSYLVLKRLGATPLRRWELIAAKALATTVTLALQVMVLCAVAMVLGWRVQPANVPHAALVGVVALVLGAAAFAGLGMAMAGRLKALLTLALVNGLFVVLLLVSGVVFPLGSLPSGLADVARLLPSGALAEVLRSAFDGSGRVLAPLGVLAVWAVVAPAMAAALFTWEER